MTERVAFALYRNETKLFPFSNVSEATAHTFGFQPEVRDEDSGGVTVLEFIVEF